MKNTVTAIAIMLTAVLTTGCASMFNGSSQQVAIRSDIEDAELFVNGQYIGKEQGVYNFQKNQNYVISAEKDGCKSAMVQANKSFDPTTLLGIFWDFGIFTILVVDGAITGAWQKFDQTHYMVNPRCTS